MSVAGIFPTVTCNLVCPPDAAGCQDDRCRLENQETAALAVITKRPRDLPILFQQLQHGGFHVNLHAEMDPVILKRPDHLQSGSIPNVSKARITMPAKIALQNAAVFRAVEKRSPSLELTHAIRRFFRM